LLVKEQVFGLKISVANTNLVNIVDTGNYLLHKAASLVFLQAFALDNVVEEFSTACVLHDEEQLARSLDNFIQLNNIGVPHYFQNVDFSCHSFDVALVLDLVFFENFDGHFFASN